ncbi:MAG TPA: hypothetical protein VFM53_12975 [Anaeromyxobacteraceae bacterium]|nr:hypothetical protein [Anaeromyxobacteraceae bacterium]
MRRVARSALALALAAAAAGCRDWRDRVDPARAAAEPEQALLAGETPIVFEAKGHEVRLTPRATYRITGYAVETSTMLLDAWDFVLPMDLTLAWGPVADPAVLRHMKFHLSGRYVSYWVDPGGPPMPVVATHVANHHLVPGSEAVAREMKRIRKGDLVTLQGRLVDVEIRDGGGRVVHRAPTSLSRDDVGSGACEQLWVEAIEIDHP